MQRAGSGWGRRCSTQAGGIDAAPRPGALAQRTGQGVNRGRGAAQHRGRACKTGRWRNTQSRGVSAAAGAKSRGRGDNAAGMPGHERTGRGVAST